MSRHSRCPPAPMAAALRCRHKASRHTRQPNCDHMQRETGSTRPQDLSIAWKNQDKILAQPLPHKTTAKRKQKRH